MTTPWDLVWTHDRYGDSARRIARARQKVDFFERVGLALTPDDVVLDLGCGSGDVTVELARRGGRPQRWLACDSSRAACDRAADTFVEAGLSVDVSHADARQLPFPAKSASIVVACGVLEHIASVGDALAEIDRVMKDDGRLFLTTSHKGSIVYFERRAREALSLWPYGFQHNYAAEEIRGLLEPSFSIRAMICEQTAWDFPLAAIGDRFLNAFAGAAWGRYLVLSCGRA